VTLRKHGIERAMVDGSGDIGVSGPPPGSDGWRIGIAPLDAADGPPSRHLLLAGAAVTTSGDAFQFVEIAGQRYSHIVDPRTGLGLTGRSSVTVVARDCTTADSLATAVSVLGSEAGLKLVEETPTAAALVVLVDDQGRKQVLASKRLEKYDAAR
jgi:thiamine biosynthesis lipoprotein